MGRTSTFASLPLIAVLLLAFQLFEQRTLPRFRLCLTSLTSQIVPSQSVPLLTCPFVTDCRAENEALSYHLHCPITSTVGVG